jgi:DNA (cytosine-5)-methyltransferase 1
MTSSPQRYPEVLAAAWRDATAPRAASAPTVVSTFAGAGGSSLGYAMAGFREPVAVEWDEHAAATFRANLGGVTVLERDIADVSAEEVLSLAGLERGQLDVLDGSPPCQGFSVVRSVDRDPLDPRNQLYREYVRLLRGLAPRAFVLENVAGMTRGQMLPIFGAMLDDLRQSGYRVSARVLGMAFYGVPQMRERLIVIGVRDDLGVDPSHPVPDERYVTVAEALEGASVATLARPTTPLDEERYAAIRRGGTHPVSYSMKRLAWDRPAFTVVKSIWEFNGSGLWHPDEPRRISVEEAKRLQGFPDEFRLEGPYVDQWARLGNSVPPLFMRRVALHVRALLAEEAS